MEEFIKKEKTPEDIFNKLFTSGKIEKISENKVPQKAMDFFEGMSIRFVSLEEFPPGKFGQFYCVCHNNDDITYITEHEKQYGENNKEKNVYFFEMRGDEKIGHGEIRLVVVGPGELFKKPFIGFSQTENGYERQGLGTRRIYEMNAYSQSHYNLPIYSDTLIDKRKAEKVWEKLVGEGKAEKVEMNDENKFYRYRLI